MRPAAPPSEFDLDRREPERFRPALYALPAALWLFATAVAVAAGVRFTFYWGLVQLLDRSALLDRPLEALPLLHAQPPGLNALLALVLRAADALGSPPEAVAWPLFAALGLASTLILFRLGWALGGGLAAAGAVVVLALADPGFQFYSAVFFYPLPLYALVAATLLCAWRWLGGGDDRWLFGLVAAVAAAALSRSLYHPLWAAGTVALTVAARVPLAGRASLRPRRLALAAALLGLLLAAWPLKNRLLFGHAVASSWTGYNLARGTPVREPALGHYVRDGEVAPDLARRWRALGHPPGIAGSPLLTAAVNEAGARNWNHYAFLLTRRDLTRRALAWRLEHPGGWAELALANYLMWSRPTGVDSYWGTPRGPDTPLWRGWCRAHSALAFADLRPLVERLPSPGLDLRTEVWGGPVPFTLFGLVLMPALAAAAARRWRRRRGARTAADWTAALAAFHLAWLLAVPCLTDGLEGNRMRFPAGPALLLLGAYALRGPRPLGATPGVLASAGAGFAARPPRRRPTGNDMNGITGPPGSGARGGAAATASGPGLELDSGLWLDRPDWAERIAHRRRLGTLDDDQAERLAHFAEHGFVVLDLDLEPGAFAAVDADVDRAWRQKPHDLAYASGGPARRFPTADEARDRRRGSRIHDLHSHSGAALDLYLHALLHDTARRILGEDAVAIQSLCFQFGSEQILHRDPVVVPTGAPLRLLAAWIALEDIHPDSGALVYVPGSHRLPYYEFAPGVYEYDARTMGADEAAAATAFDDQQARRHGLAPKLFTPRRGQALIWHASLRHGGSPVRDPERTRKSFVVHYSTAGTYPTRSITLAEPEPGGGDRFEVWETERLLERPGGRGFDNPLRGRPQG